ncbi:MAG TPA: hypothetical protein VLX29_01970, partial [Nitrospirota bacterium]|nr:hypothetical protein [Nitrospirota bacterium]
MGALLLTYWKSQVWGENIDICFNQKHSPFPLHTKVSAIPTCRCFGSFETIIHTDQIPRYLTKKKQ